MTKRSYGQYCALARGLELIGEPWALLIVRNLLVSPCRTEDLRRALPRMPESVLTTRLGELEATGIVRPRALPAPERATVYELTAFGRELDETIVALARWGAKALGDPRADESLTIEALVTLLRSAFRANAARGLTANVELRVGPIVVGIALERGIATIAEGALPKPDLVIRTGAEIAAVMSGTLAVDDALARGVMTVEGNARLLARFAEIFTIDPLPSEIPA